VVFGILHWEGTLLTLSTGLAVWAIDVAYRWFQTMSPVMLTIDRASANVVLSICIPLQVRTALEPVLYDQILRLLVLSSHI
jgi:hypothetical protein